MAWVAARTGLASLWAGGIAAALVVAGASAVAAEPAPDPCSLARPRLTGDWGGAREDLADRGVEAGARYTSGFWSNVRGGFRTGTRYEGFAQWSLSADLDRLLDWKGGAFEINWYSYHGGQPSEDLVGVFATQTISGHETVRSVRFYEILLRQSWDNGRFLVKAGQLAADTDFFVSDYSDALLNGTFGFLGLGRATEIAPFYPLAAPGAYFRARSADERWQAHVGVYSADPGEDRESNLGFDWSFDNGAFFIGELGTRYSLFGRPGSLAVGAVGTTAELENFATGGSVNEGYGLFGGLDQLLFEETSARPGLGLFLRSYGGPQEERSLVRWYVDFGLKLTRPFRGRDRDVLSLGFAYLRLTDSYVGSQRRVGLDVSKQQTVLELTYRFQATGWLSLQPDVQFVFDPHFSRRDAIVIGLRAVAEL